MSGGPSSTVGPGHGVAWATAPSDRAPCCSPAQAPDGCGGRAFPTDSRKSVPGGADPRDLCQVDNLCIPTSQLGSGETGLRSFPFCLAGVLWFSENRLTIKLINLRASVPIKPGFIRPQWPGRSVGAATSPGPPDTDVPEVPRLSFAGGARAHRRVDGEATEGQGRPLLGLGRAAGLGQALGTWEPAWVLGPGLHGYLSLLVNGCSSLSRGLHTEHDEAVPEVRTRPCTGETQAGPFPV